MANAVKSIFRQREVEGKYKRVEVFQAHGDNFNYYYNLSASDNVISDNIIGEYDIEKIGSQSNQSLADG